MLERVARSCALLLVAVVIAPVSGASAQEAVVVAPGRVQIHPGYDDVGLTWIPSGDFDGFRVYRHADGTATAVADVPGSRYVADAPHGSTHTFSVTTLLNGAESAHSHSVTGTVDGDTAAGDTGRSLAVSDQVWGGGTYAEPEWTVRATQSSPTLDGDTPDAWTTFKAVRAGEDPASSGPSISVAPPEGGSWKAGTYSAGSARGPHHAGLATCWHGSATLTVHAVRAAALALPDLLVASYSVTCPGRYDGDPTTTSSGEIVWSSSPRERPLLSPTHVSFAETPVHATSAARVVKAYGGETPARMSAATLTGDAADFRITADGCTGRTIATGETCAVTVAATPTAAGSRQAQLVLADATGPLESVDLAVVGIGESEPAAPPGLPSLGVLHSPGALRVSWRPAAIGAPVDGYRLYGSHDRTRLWRHSSGVARSAVIDNVAPGRTYFLRLEAVNAYGTTVVERSVRIPTSAVVFASRDAAGPTLMARFPGTSKATPVYGNDRQAYYDPAVSPDGRWIAFVVRHPSSYDHLYVRPLDGSGSWRQLSWGSSDDSRPAWSPDSTRIALTRRPAGAAPRIHVVDVADGSSRTVRNSVGTTQPSWRADGRHLVVTDVAGRHLDVVSVYGSSRRSIAGSYGGSSPEVSPRGDQVLFRRAMATGAVPTLLPISGGTPRRAGSADATGIGSLTWTSHGRFVYQLGGALYEDTVAGDVPARLVQATGASNPTYWSG